MLRICTRELSASDHLDGSTYQTVFFAPEEHYRSRWAELVSGVPDRDRLDTPRAGVLPSWNQDRQDFDPEALSVTELLRRKFVLRELPPGVPAPAGGRVPGPGLRLVERYPAVPKGS